jgi:hypothetical protein
MFFSSPRSRIGHSLEGFKAFFRAMWTVLAGIILVKHKHCHSSLSQGPPHPDPPDWFVKRGVARRPVAHNQYTVITKRDSEVVTKPVILPIAVENTGQLELSMERYTICVA